uniref:Uncharacterized protein n=1 Tax=Anguilla anguilla TaxID=7936 RepID=A0A0E9XAD8_ANGAN
MDSFCFVFFKYNLERKKRKPIQSCCMNDHVFSFSLLFFSPFSPWCVFYLNKKKKKKKKGQKIDK